jgi:magnesium transporter
VSVVAAHLYRNGKNAKAVSLDEPIDCKGFGLHPLAIEDALKANQMPKVDVYGDQLL